MYKEIFKLVVAIISQPGKAWDILTRKEEKDDEFLSRFVYPLIGFVTVAAFLGVLFTRITYIVFCFFRTFLFCIYCNFM